ncbi:hypothetical protein BD414DRAFT_497774 [Trametes punicea]|nr:hypothetical protein BD414DRAFT_497774 [Trametes punicea]
MDDFYGDMPALVDSHRGFDSAAPYPLPAAVGIPSPYFPLEQQHGPPPSSYMHNSHSFSPSSGYPWATPTSSQTTTPSAWPQMQTMPGTPLPMFAPPPVVAIQPFVPVVTNQEGWQSHSGEQEQDHWKHDQRDDGLYRRPSMRSSTPHSQTISLTSTPSSDSPALSRQTSLRGPAAEAAKRPPREWRTDFSMSGLGLLGNLSVLTRSRSRSFRGSESPPPKVKLCPYIIYNSSKPPMWLDLRHSPDTIRFRAVQRQLYQSDLSRFACEPPLPHIRLYHAQLPWYVDVEASNPSGVTLYDLFYAIYCYMMRPIEYGDYYNIEMNYELRDRIACAWAERCTSEEERRKGVRRVDYLMGKVIMEGVQKGRDGLWEIKTRRP